jgi:hypothetical protein
MRLAILGTGLSAVLAVGGCTAANDTPAPAPQAPPPPPPAACLLDGATLAATTGLTWTPDQTTATDTRCVYDPAAAAGFLAVELAPATDDAATQLDTIAQLCVAGSRADVEAADGGFVCRFDGANVYAAMVRGDRLVTISSSAVPVGTTGAKLAVAFAEQLRAIRPA